jgi:hypothetical protein
LSAGDLFPSVRLPLKRQAQYDMSAEAALLQGSSLVWYQSNMKPKRISRYVQMAHIAHEIAQDVLPLYSHPNSPKTYTQPQLAACLILMIYLGLSYRDMEEWLLATDKVCHVLELHQVPDHTTLNRTMTRLSMPLLQAINQTLLTRLEVEEDAIAVDSTGFTFTQASLHFLTCSRRQPYSQYAKGFYAVGIDSQYIVAWRFALGPGSDMGYLDGLRRDAHRFARLDKGRRSWILLADRGFDGEDARAHDLIPPRRPVKRPDRQQRNAMVDMAILDGFFGQRWKCETVNSVIKRKSGSSIRSRRRLHQRREVALKGLAYNIHRSLYIVLLWPLANLATKQLKPTCVPASRSGGEEQFNSICKVQ